MNMDKNISDNQNEILLKYLASLTPLERAAHRANTSAWMLANWVLISDVAESINEIDVLRCSKDLEERALLPIAELSLTETISALPSYGEA